MEHKGPEHEREMLRQKELKNSGAGNLKDSFNRTENGNFQDFTGSMSTRTLGIIIVLLILVIFMGWLIFR